MTTMTDARKELLKASRILPGLYQGPKPPTGPLLRRLGFRLLVLCANEYQPAAPLFEGVRVIHAPNDDGPSMTQEQEQRVKAAAIEVAKAIRARQRVLVTCRMGHNRSGLVTAAALHLLTGRSGRTCAAYVQAARPGALRNPYFVGELAKLPRRAGAAGGESSRPPA